MVYWNNNAERQYSFHFVQFSEYSYWELTPQLSEQLAIYSNITSL